MNVKDQKQASKPGMPQGKEGSKPQSCNSTKSQCCPKSCRCKDCHECK